MDDEDIRLPEDTQRILNEFLSEQAKQQQDNVVSENWNLSQFWYSDETQKLFGQLMKKLLRKYDVDDISVALLSCPSLYQTISSVNDKTKVFEFDKRFESFGASFQFYDYNKADEENYLSEYSKSFDLIIADPPFLSEECLQKTAIIIKRLMKENGKIILNTGSIQRDHAKRYLDLNETNFKPQHRNNLGNEFSCFSNFDVDSYM